MKLRTIILGAVFALVGSLVALQSAHAITLIPPSLEFGVKPGESLESKIKLFNETGQTLTVYASTDNFTAGDDEGTPKFLNTPGEDLASWMTISTDAITLDPGERADVPFTVNVPTNADPGGHYAAVFFSDQPVESGGAVAVGSKVGALLILRVDGVVREAGELSDFTTVTGQQVFSRLPIDFLIRFANQGNVHVRPTGTITVRNIIGGTSVELPVNTSQGAVLPASDRKFEVAWEKESNLREQGNFFQEIGREWNNFGIGAYTADVQLTYGLSSDKSANATIRFWIFPWRLLLAVVVVIVLVIFLLVWFFRWYNQMIVSRAQQKPAKKA